MPLLKAVLIGAGHIADSNHIPALKQLSDRVDVVAVCSRDLIKARALADKHGIPSAFDNTTDMYRQCAPDLVVICTPNNLHFPQAMEAMEHGCHVFCEKPPAISAQNARDMANLAAQKGLTLAYNFQLRQTSEWSLLTRCQTDGLMGDIYHIKAHFLRRRGIPGWGYFTDKSMQGGGALMDLGVHVLDLALCALGYPVPDQVVGSTYDFIGRAGGKGLMGTWDPATFGVEDAAMAYLTFPDKTSIMLSASFALNTQADIDRNLEIFGRKGGANLFPFALHTELAGELADVHFPYLEEVDIQLKNTAAFLDACAGKPSNVCTAEQGAILQEVVERIYQSAAS
ncbi:Gfo/Idh/MocA family protein [Spirosoma utsteinense]|uniref:Dehydrogenase n=1 Tax=Spirosoma utsteinense TaxID=2585773 RepID=A0ABR6VZ53_9BACT|nr:Gfo/Idh/MocA family oxidoreductase [Spirosoma utsteinense]MBC3784654.1 putative dehydrogenase [Spirosoma utsteinense]MBC3789592.1 putative dehydrogenase [Spirosoma utsteinense]